MQLFPPGEQQHGGDGERHRYPWRQRECDGAKQIGVDVERGHHEADIRLAVFILFADVLAIEDVSQEPSTISPPVNAKECAGSKR